MHYLRILTVTAAIVTAAAGAPSAMAEIPQGQSSSVHIVRAGGGGEGFHGRMGGFHGGGFHGGYAMHGYHSHGYGYYVAPYPYCP
jgi:hypothetical protein